MISGEGEVIWERQYYLQDHQVRGDVCSSGDGGCLIVCSSVAPSVNVPIVLWIRVDVVGDTLFTGTFSVPGYQTVVSAVAFAPDSGFILGGEISIPNQGSSALLIKLDANGHIEFWRTYRFSVEDDIEDITVLNDGTYVMCGLSDEMTTDPYHGIALRVSSTGDSLWAWSAPRPFIHEDRANKVIPTSDGGFAICRMYDPNLQLLRFGPSNELLWLSDCMFPAVYSYAGWPSVHQDTHGCFVLDVNCFFRDTVVDYPMVGILKTAADPVSVLERGHALLPYDLQLKIYPNPFNSTTTISLNIPSSARRITLTTYNLLGQVVREDRLPAAVEQISYHYDASALASGIYLLRAEAGAFSQTTKLVVMK
jgi:hypothetical protein